MTFPAYMTITSDNQGDIKGSSQIKGLEETITIYSYDHCVEILKNRESNHAIGQRLHKDLTVSKEIDKSTPKLYQALCTGDKCDVELVWYLPTHKEQKTKIFKIFLEKAIITKLQPKVMETFSRSFDQTPYLEDVSFAYQKITWTWIPDGTEFVDTWQVAD